MSFIQPLPGQLPIRLQVSLASAPPQSPIDANTGVAPQINRCNAVALLTAFFDAYGNPINIASFVSVSLFIQPAQNSPYTVISKTVLNAAFNGSLITVQGWKAQQQWNVQFNLTNADTDVSLGCQPSQQYWLIVQGTNADGSTVVLGTGPITFVQTGLGYPNPTALPITSRHATANVSGDFTITPTSQLHTEIVTLSGVARTNNCILANTNIQDGARLTVMWKIPSTTGILINLESTVVSNPVLVEVATGDVLSGRTCFYYDASVPGWVGEKYDFPAP